MMHRRFVYFLLTGCSSSIRANADDFSFFFSSPSVNIFSGADIALRFPVSREKFGKRRSNYSNSTDSLTLISRERDMLRKKKNRRG